MYTVPGIFNVGIMKVGILNPSQEPLGARSEDTDDERYGVVDYTYSSLVIR